MFFSCQFLEIPQTPSAQSSISLHNHNAWQIQPVHPTNNSTFCARVIRPHCLAKGTVRTGLLYCEGG